MLQTAQFFFCSSTHCPLSRGPENYQQLQEMAKGIPQETIEECDENNEEEVSETRYITGPSGDVKVVNQKTTVWSMDSDDKKCTCVPPKGLQFQQIINKFNGNPSCKSIVSSLFSL